MAAGAPGLAEKANDVPYVYVLKCADDSLYCGWTTDLSRRLAAHQAGTASRYTRSRLPVEVAKVFAVADRSAALRLEARIKRLSRAAKLSLVRDTRAKVEGDSGRSIRRSTRAGGLDGEAPANQAGEGRFDPDPGASSYPMDEAPTHPPGWLAAKKTP